DTRVAIQGFGNVGSAAATLFFRTGAKIVAVSDVRGGVYNHRGLDIWKLNAHLKATGSVVGFAESEPITNEGIITAGWDVLVPAALQNQITARNAPSIHARYIVEGANGPTTPQADIILRDRGITVIPDVLANAGGVTVSYFEWVQGLQSFFWTESEVNSKL